MDDIGKLEPRPPMHKTIQDAIRQYIIQHGLRPGDPMLPETELAKQLGVSRNSVREAVKSLESVGVLESRRGSGLYVRDFSWEPLLDNLVYDLMRDLREFAELLEIRRVLEVGMVEEAIKRLQPEQLADLRRLLGKMEARASRGETFPEEDREFHRTLFRELRNATFLKLLDLFWLAFRKASDGRDLLDQDPLRTYEAHRAIVESVSTGDVAGARRALGAHYEAVSSRLERELGPTTL